ncbi:class III lanthionine synthetase LanKC N-terminal domain-containing protein [Streptomyces herbicida]|uniref:class III lanthionine synthetase LanKC N-terminal domain-containing protein n=1 Tax=Streptomyces herbicida TaxID=3065675 RepID=UPI00292F201D|nr:lanthionine synthetase LanC family protein [Streptomyces sp. NEAU-HV9]
MFGHRGAEWREVLTADGNTPFTPLVDSLLGNDWESRADGFWLHARLIGSRLPVQGWKLHVSAVPDTAATVLAACVPVLREHRVAFKCAEDTAVLLQLLSSRYEAGGMGKFLTAYPPDAGTCVAVGDLLAEATAGLAGPTVVSDATWQPGSPVHFRYGAFTTEDRLTDDGRFVPVLLRPDGTAERDVRDRFSPPSWAPALPRPAAVRTPDAGRALLVADRYRIESVLRRSARGGVFSGQDLATGQPVVIKHARAHVGVTPAGQDARDVLGHEARVLRELSGTGVVPDLIDLVETERATYLVEERLEGVTLRQFAAEQWSPGQTVGDQVWQVATSLARAVSAVHAAGWTLCDLSPGNVMVGPAGHCTLVDLELAARPGDRVLRDNTPGYASPEQRYAALVDRAPGPAADCHALGGLLFLLAAGRDPLHLNGMWSAGERLAGQLSALQDRQGFAASVAPLVEALLHGDPRDRPTAAATASRLVRLKAARSRTSAATGRPGGGRAEAEVPRSAARTVLADGIGELVELVRRRGPEALLLDVPWRSRRDGVGADFGVCGPLLLLTRAMAVPPSLTGVDPTRLHDAIRRIVEHLQRLPRPDSLSSGPRLGLGTGEAGCLWALWDAAAVLDDRGIRARLLARATELTTAVRPLAGAGGTPLRLSLGHGIAGLGTLQLKLYLATGSAELRQAALTCADALLAAHERAAEPDAGGLLDGTAGVAWFLLALGHALDHDPAVSWAEQTVRKRCERVVKAVTGPGPRLAHHDGLAGEGRLLAAAARHGMTTEYALRRIEDLVKARHSTAPTGLARGISGWTEFLLDVDAGGGTAEPLLAAIAARANIRHGRITVPDDSGAHVNHSLADGGCGALWVLLRAADQRPGLWDPATARTVRTPAAATPLRGRVGPPDLAVTEVHEYPPGTRDSERGRSSRASRAGRP